MKNSVQPFFEVRDLHFGYRRAYDVLRGIGFAIAPGEMTAIIGPNGAGKSTLLHVMLGLLAPTAGVAMMEGVEVGAIPPEVRARRAAFVPQAAHVPFPYTVAEITAMGRHAHRGNLSAADGPDRAAVEEAMRLTGIWELRRRLFGEISGGEAQRTLIARALAQEASALLLDEPTSSLDLHYQAAIYGLLARLNADRGQTVVIVTHDINLAAQYCRRVIGMKNGEVLFEGSPGAMLTAEQVGHLYDVAAERIDTEAGPIIRARPSSR